ncbi:PREDICTED: triggering receptor expressed on myeloid cells 1-like, partial [Mesitornis unicolor]|uniref:triggering receptor expressed on myeloid cells 1-like n=1 Tax=Mesitornis unicolor TaxID=54374 RepID=UPI000528D2E0
LQAQIPDAEESRLEGSSLSIQCPYTERTYYSDPKAWCRLRHGKCEPLVETTYSPSHPNTNSAKNGKVTIVDDAIHKTVSITMTNLQAEDLGTYFCAYYSNGYGYFTLKMISLNVFK